MLDEQKRFAFEQKNSKRQSVSFGLCIKDSKTLAPRFVKFCSAIVHLRLATAPFPHILCATYSLQMMRTVCSTNYVQKEQFKFVYFAEIFRLLMLISQLKTRNISQWICAFLAQIANELFDKWKTTEIIVIPVKAYSMLVSLHKNSERNGMELKSREFNFNV